MAFSRSIKRAQAIKLCEFCKNNSIKWRCIDCDMCLCEKCKTFHLRVPASAQHKTVTIGTPLQNVHWNISIHNIPCKEHTKNMVCWFCRSCDSLICPECASTSHNKHKTDSIESALHEKLDSLQSIHDKVNVYLKSCESKTSEMQDLISMCGVIFDGSLTKIKQKEQELIDVITKHSKDLQDKVEKERSRINSIISKIQQDTDTKKKILEDQREEIDAVLNSHQGSIIFNTNMIIKDLEFYSTPYKVEQFIPQTKAMDKIHKLFGSLQTLSISTTHVHPEVVRTFTTDLPYIDGLATFDKTSAWISSSKKQLISKVSIQDHSHRMAMLTTFQEVSLEVYDMTVTSNNELLLSMSNGSDVKLLKRSGKIVPFLTVDPLLPLGIHMTKYNEIILGVKEPGNLYTPTEQSQRAVIVYDELGQEKQRYQIDDKGKRMFTYPKTIRTNYNRDIIVADGSSDISGRVVVLNKEGNLRWVYRGHDIGNGKELFDPCGIVTTSVGHIVVSDWGSEAFHVLSEDGEVLTCKVMGGMGIKCPYSLDIDNCGRMWLGCGTAGEKTGAKLYIIKLIP